VIVCQGLAAGRWFSPCPPVSSTNKTDRYDITEPCVPEYNLWFVVNHIVYCLEFVHQVKLKVDRFCMGQRKIFKSTNNVKV
jgi:hypothetical protein